MRRWFDRLCGLRCCECGALQRAFWLSWNSRRWFRAHVHLCPECGVGLRTKLSPRSYLLHALGLVTIVVPAFLVSTAVVAQFDALTYVDTLERTQPKVVGFVLACILPVLTNVIINCRVSKVVRVEDWLQRDHQPNGEPRRGDRDKGSKRSDESGV
ncbi:MAG: hypothetical protein AAF409_19325 [Pseudomonadota bacterium]